MTDKQIKTLHENHIACLKLLALVQSVKEKYRAYLIKLIRDKITDIIVKQILLKRKLAKNRHCKHHAHHEKAKRH
jgi:hypothetical protein